MPRRLGLLLPVLSLLALAVPASRGGAAAHAHDGRSAARGLTVAAEHWGPLRLGMSHRQAQRTGMVSREMSACMPGYRMTERFGDRGYVVWRQKGQRFTVRQIVVTGRSDRTAARRGVGSTLRQLRGTYPRLTGIRSGSSLEGQRPARRDVHVVSVPSRRGFINFQFAYGRRPGPASRVDQVVVSREQSVFYGC